MTSNEAPRFIFHGNAMPFGGRITKKGNTTLLATIPGPPAAALGVVGGLSRASAGASKPHDSFSWASTFAEAKGEQLSSTRYRTTVTSSITKVWARNDPHIFEADALSVTMVSEHANLGPASIRITEVSFKGLKLGNDRIEVNHNDDDLNDNPTLDSYEDKYQTNKDLFERHNAANPGAVRLGDPAPRTPGGYILTSIVQSVKWRNKTYPGNTLRLSGFGTIYFGEVLINRDNRRLTMVRLKMGSDIGADCCYAEADPNGTWGN